MQRMGTYGHSAGGDRTAARGRHALALLCAALAAGLLGGAACSRGPVQTAPMSIEGLPLGEAYPYRSPMELAVSDDGAVAFVIQHTGMSVETVNARTGELLHSTPLAAAPSGLALDAARGRLYVTRGLAGGAVDVIDTESGRILHSLPAGHTPVAPVVSADGRTLYVGRRFEHRVEAMDVATGAVRASASVAREPIAAALTPDGALLVVAQHLPAQAATAGVVAAQVDLFAAPALERVATVTLPSGSTGVRTVCISPDGAHAYVTHTLGRFSVPTTQLERGWMNTSALSILDLAEKKWLTTVLLDDVDQGAANPWGVACTADGATLLVTHSGTHELSVIDRPALHARIGVVAGGARAGGFSTSLDDIPNDLSFLVGLRRRVRLPGNGPRGVALAGGAALVAEYFSDSLARVELGGEGAPAVTSLPLGEPVEPNLVRRGEIAFFDAAHCFQQWQSCASCHPDVRADGLNWDLLNDGLGNPKNNRTLLHTHVTPPVMITGIRESAEVAVRAGFRFIQFVQVSEDVATATDEYLKVLQPVPSPSLVNGALSDAARRGRQVFQQARCDTCHTGEYYTDGLKHDVGTGPDELGIKLFVTPPLTEVWRTAPYLYDGRAATMREVFAEFNPEDRHGTTSTLTPAQIDDLVEYVRSL
jgi:DNA-binding beta-propeller fold protein YncE/mono/diheme cytochrome c family protein